MKYQLAIALVVAAALGSALYPLAASSYRDAYDMWFAIWTRARNNAWRNSLPLRLNTTALSAGIIFTGTIIGIAVIAVSAVEIAQALPDLLVAGSRRYDTLRESIDVIAVAVAIGSAVEICLKAAFTVIKDMTDASRDTASSQGGDVREENKSDVGS